MLCLREVHAHSTTVIRPKDIKKLSRLFFGVLSRRSASNQSFALAHENYPGSEDQNEEKNSPVLVIHGMLGLKKNWHTFCRTYSIRTGTRTIAVDCRNHGQSPRSDHMTYPLMAGDIAETLKKLNIPKVVLIGHSMGGKVAMETALSLPDVTGKLILVDTTPVSMSVKVQSVSMVPMVLSAMLGLDLTKVNSRKDADELLKESIPFDGLRAWVLTNLYKDKKGQFHWHVNIHNVQRNSKTLFGDIELSERKPHPGDTLFIGGGESDVLRNVDMNEIVKMYPKAKLEMIPGAGHFVHADKPHEFLEIVKNFLR